MKSILPRLCGLFLLIIISKPLYSQDFQAKNEQLYKQLDTIQNIRSKKLIIKHYHNGSVREIGVYVIKLVEKRKIHDYVGFHLNYYKNGNIKDSLYFDIHSNLSGIGKEYFEDGKVRYIAIGRDVSIEDGMRYSKFRTGLCDSYSIYYYKNGNIGSEFGVNFRKNNNWIMDHAICSISYNEDGTIKSSTFYLNK
jgi:antitoxin component YwqK of YwqJK toxin-antitoxin module